MSTNIEANLQTHILDKYKAVEELVEIKTENGEIFKAYPTFYNFKLINDKVVSCNSYWNGEFLHGEIKKSNITHYRKIK